MIRVVQFLNQIQAGLGGDERMDIEPRAEQGAVGMGMLSRISLARSSAATIISWRTGKRPPQN